MSDSPFVAPSLESLAASLPAFEFDRLIAKGGMGAVYKARHRLLERDVAIKVLPPELGDDDGYRACFEAEAQVMAKVTHPNLVTIYESGDVDGLLFIVMEFVEGKSLFDHAHHIAIDPHKAVSWILDICRGLGEAHKAGIVHRDIKPANILLTSSGKPKIADFGLARPAGHQAGGLAMGTPGYTAPEISHHPELADPRSDIFSVGVILQELLTGISADDDKSSDELIADPDLKKICRMASHADPAKRFKSTDAMIHSLEQWMQTHSAAPAPKRSRRRSRRKRSPHQALIRTLAIIAVLAATFVTTWKIREARGENQTAENLPTPPANPTEPTTPTPEPPTPEPLLPDRPVVPVVPEAPPVATQPPAPTPPANPTPPTKETPAQSLLRLRSALAEGNFSELPIGTLTRGDSHYFYVPRSTPWQSASRLARAYGGHLPIIRDQAELEWLTASIPPPPEDDPTKELTWIGASRTSPDLWQWVSSLPWDLDTPPAGSGSHAAIRRDGGIETASATAAHPFFIQWHRDGSNPTNLRQILAECAASQETENPFYPPGIQTFGNRRILIVQETHTHADAIDLAEVGGGKLMSAATMEEADWLEKQLSRLSAPQGLWLGATHRNDLWQWDDQQAWTFARWADDSRPGAGDTLLIQPNKGWYGVDSDHQASGMVIEWSEESRAESPRRPADDLEAFEQRASELLNEFDLLRDKAVVKNAKDYLWQLDIWLRRRRNSAEVDEWRPRVRNVKSKVKGGRLPDNIPSKPDSTYHPPLHEIAKFHAKKQAELDRGFLTKAMTVRDSYVGRLNEEATKAQGIGQREAALIFREKAAAAGDLRAWVATFKFEND